MKPSRKQLWQRLATLLATMRARKTGSEYVEAGLILIQLKDDLGHGKFLAGLKVIRLHERTAERYMQAAKGHSNPTCVSDLSLNQLIAAVKKGRRIENAEGHEKARRLAIEEAERNAALKGIPLEEHSFRVIAGDCRKIQWRDDADAIYGDPPWNDLGHYEWLADFAASHLRPGGILLAQCGQERQLPDVLAILGAKLTYLSTLAIKFDANMPCPTSVFSLSWRPVLLFSRGKWNRKGLKKPPDGWNVSAAEAREAKKYHEWGQPVSPFKRWFEAITRPGSLIFEPWACTGTGGVAVKLAGGGREYVGCEIDEQMVRFARARIAATKPETDQKRKKGMPVKRKKPA